MKASATSLVFSLSLIFLCSSTAYTQVAEATEASSTAPIDYVYIQVAKGVNVYSETAAGKLTLVKGSPFVITGQMEGITDSHLLSVGTADLRSYQIASTGAIGKQLASIDTSEYDPDGCGPTTGNQAMLDHTGKFFYVQLSQGNGCADGGISNWQSYEIGANGAFTFLGNNYTTDSEIPTTAPVFDSSDRYGYRFAQIDLNGDWGFVPLSRTSAGDIEFNSAFTERDPEQNPSAGYYLEPFMAAADPNEHLAVVMLPVSNCDEECLPGGTGGPAQLASYTVNPATGAIASTNTQADAPFLQMPGAYALDMSPDGKFVAVGGDGLEVFNFNGAAVPTKLTGLLLPSTRIDQVAWDKSDHLFALSHESHELYMFNVSKAKGVVEIGSPVSVPGAYGLTGIIVVPK